MQTWPAPILYDYFFLFTVAIVPYWTVFSKAGAIWSAMTLWYNYINALYDVFHGPVWYECHVYTYVLYKMSEFYDMVRFQNYVSYDVSYTYCVVRDVLRDIWHLSVPVWRAGTTLGERSLAYSQHIPSCALLNWINFRFRCGTGKLKCHRFLTTFCYI